MTERDLASNVVRRLNEGLQGLAPGAAQRLLRAREAALAHAQARRSSLQLVGAQGGAAGPHHRWSLGTRVAAPILALIIATFAVLYWQQQVRHALPPHDAEFADVDTEVLTGDLPVVAYLDPGFEIWLYHHAPATRED